MADDGSRTPYQPLDAVAYTPVAEEVNTFVQPQKPQDLTPNMDSLAKGLSQFDQGMNSFLQERQSASDENDKVQAQADAMKGNQEGWAKGVQDGHILAQHSPVYVQNYKQSMGLLAGDQLTQKFDEQYKAAGGGSMDEPTMNAFRQKFISDNVATTDKDTLIGILPTLRKLAVTSEHRYQSDRDAYLKAGATTTFGANTNTTLDQGHTDGTLNPTGTDTDALYGKVVAARNVGLQAGLEPGFGDNGIDKQIVDRVAAMAIQNRDDKTLAILDKQVPGQSYTYAQTPYGQEKLREAQSSLLSANNKDVETALKLQKAADEKKKAGLLTQGYRAAAADLTHPVPQGIIDALGPLEPDAAKKFADFQETLTKSHGVQDPDQDIAVQQEIIHGGGMAAVLRARDEGHITSAEAFTRLTKQAEDFDKNRSVVDTITNDPTYKGWQKLIGQRAGTGKIDPTDPLSPMGQTPESLGLTAKMNTAMLNWAVNHQGATPQDRQAAIDAIGNLYVAAIQGDSMAHTVGPVDQGKVDAITGGAPGATSYAGKTQPPAATVPPGSPQPPASNTSPAGLAPQVPGAQTDADGIPQITPEHIKTAVQALTSQGGAQDRVELPPGMSYQDGTRAGSAAPAGAPTAPSAPLDPTTFKDPAVGAFAQGFTPAQQATMATMAQKQGVQPEAIYKQAYDTAVAHGHEIPTPGDAVVPGTQAAPPVSTTTHSPGSIPPVPIAKPPSAAQQQAGSAIDGALRSESDPVSDAVMAKVSSSFDNILQGKDDPLAAPQGGYQLATLKDDPKAAHILDFVGATELGATHGANYNAYYGHAASDIDLSKMTLNQVKDFMKTRGTASSATGRYQFMHDTLFGNSKTGAPGLVQRMGLDPNTTKFTPLLQDTMAVQLLKDRGYDQWRQGKMSTNTFANNLAKEWASLPNMQTGMSHYAGDGVNHALTSREKVASVLGGPNDMGSPAQATPPTGLVSSGKPPSQNVYEDSNPNNGPNHVYGNIPDVDEDGRPDQKKKFMAWNPDPVANNAKNVKTLHPDLQAIVTQAQADNPGAFVAGSGKRTKAMEKIAVQNGWAPAAYAKANGPESKHKDGRAVDLWPLDEHGRITFDPDKLRAINSMMKAAAVKVGKTYRAGADFKKADLPHYEVD